MLITLSSLQAGQCGDEFSAAAKFSVLVQTGPRAHPDSLTRG